MDEFEVLQAHARDPFELISNTWPPTTPSAPMSLTSSPIPRTILASGMPTVNAAMCSNAIAKSVSPASTAKASPKAFVARGLSAAEIIVVHARKVVVDQRHGVDHLHSASREHGHAFGATDELAGGDAEDGADSLATGKEGVAHGLVKLMGLFQRNGGVEGLVDGINFLGYVIFETEGGV
jgi:hypothetical protein